METKLFQEALATLKKDATQRKFVQTYDLIVSLKDIDLKKPDQQVDFYFQLPHGLGKSMKICGLVGAELYEHAKEILDKTIIQSDFERLTKKEIKKLAEEHTFFVAQANIMTKMAAVFGRVLGPRGKMPNPKAGCVVPPKANLVPLRDQLQKTIRCKTRNAPVVQVSVGTSDMADDKVVENMAAAYDAVLHHAPKEQNNIRNVFIKLTMSKPVKVL